MERIEPARAYVVHDRDSLEKILTVEADCSVARHRSRLAWLADDEHDA